MMNSDREPAPQSSLAAIVLALLALAVLAIVFFIRLLGEHARRGM